VLSADRGGTLVVPTGELDLDTTPELEAVLVAQEGRVVVDLRELTFADATGLRALLRAEARCRNNGMNLAFIRGPAVQRLIDIVRLSNALTFTAPPDVQGRSDASVVSTTLTPVARRRRVARPAIGPIRGPAMKPAS
jgi:anti-sigma B factor antagonist